MRIFGWWKRDGRGADVQAWHRAWETALADLDQAAPARLEAALRHTPPFADDVEVEEEMLEALREALALAPQLEAARLPLIDTAHRAAAGEPCHFSAPVSMPDDPAQPTGRLLLTSRRAAFAGGSRTPTVAWHAARGVVREGRDVVLVGVGVDEGLRFRCNTFGDAVRAAAIARHLVRAARQPL